MKKRDTAVFNAVGRFMDTAAYAASQSARSVGQLSQEDGELKAKLGRLAALAAEIKTDCETARGRG